MPLAHHCCGNQFRAAPRVLQKPANEPIPLLEGAPAPGETIQVPPVILGREWILLLVQQPGEGYAFLCRAYAKGQPAQAVASFNGTSINCRPNARIDGPAQHDWGPLRAELRHEFGRAKHD